METITQLPFASLTNEQFHNILQNNADNHLFELNFNPFTVPNDKYNSELDVNHFYLQLRQLKLQRFGSSSRW